MSIETDSDDGHAEDDAGLSPAMVRRLERACEEEAAAGSDPLVEDPSIDVEMFRRVMRRKVADYALSRRRIYLDMNYWIWLRNAAFREPGRTVHTELWRRLRKLTEAGRILCPVSHPVFSEVMKQNDGSRRRQACVIDRLCGGVCIVDQFSRMRVQLSHFAWTKLLGDRTLPPADRFVWAPVSHILGMGTPHHPDLAPSLNLQLQKTWIAGSQFWRFSDLFEQMRGVPPTEPNNWRFALSQNFMCDWTRDNLRSLKATYKIEVGNSTDLIAEKIADFAEDLFSKGIRSPLGPEAGPRDLAASLAGIITAGLKMGRITTDFPEYHIMGVVHATIRWMRRRHEANDQEDHQHAAAALPYCAFFTERGMRDILARGPFHLDRAYGCRVISDPNEALAYLEAE